MCAGDSQRDWLVVSEYGGRNRQRGSIEQERGTRAGTWAPWQSRSPPSSGKFLWLLLPLLGWLLQRLLHSWHRESDCEGLLIRADELAVPRSFSPGGLLPYFNFAATAWFVFSLPCATAELASFATSCKATCHMLHGGLLCQALRPRLAAALQCNAGREL